VRKTVRAKAHYIELLYPGLKAGVGGRYDYVKLLPDWNFGLE